MGKAKPKIVGFDPKGTAMRVSPPKGQETELELLMQQYREAWVEGLNENTKIRQLRILVKMKRKAAEFERRKQ